MNHVKYPGPYIALAILLAWLAVLGFALTFLLNWLNPLPYFLILIITHLYTGLFISAHDAMHGTLSPKRKVNNTLGWVCALLFAFNWYPRLYKNHHLHHNRVATLEDPDYHNGGFWTWYFHFIKNYITLWQVVAMGIAFNLLMLIFPKPNLVAFWILPSILSTLQLFYFGTYLPHKGVHAADNPHKSSTQPKNHIFAFLSCYFFGYHYEHHDSPGTPWWLLYRKKQE